MAHSSSIETVEQAAERISEQGTDGLVCRHVESTLLKWLDGIISTSGRISGSLLLVMSGITCYEVLSRYIFHTPTNWTLDLSVYLLIWFGFLAMGYVDYCRSHVRVDLILSRFSNRTRAVLEVLNGAIFFVFAVVLFFLTIRYFLNSYQANETTWATWQVLYWPVKIALPIGAGLLSLQLFKRLLVGILELPSNALKGGSVLVDRPAFVVCTFLIFIVISIFLYTVNPVLGLVILLLVLLFGGVPIFPALGLVGMLGLYTTYGWTAGVASSVAPVSFNSLESFSLACLPLFVVVGQLIQSSGVSKELFDAANRWVGHLPGGEGIATILACAIFSAVAVSSVATALTIGLVALPSLIAHKYNKNMSYGMLAAGGTLGILIPPSGTMIIYSAVTDESLGKLFLAGIVPGLIIVILFTVFTVLYCSYTGEYERSQKATWKERFETTKTAMWGLIAPLLIIGGIYSGVFTPLESGGVAMGYVVIMVLVRRKLNLWQIITACTDSARSSVMVLCIMIGAMIMGDFMTTLQVPDKAIEAVTAMNLPPWGVIVVLMLIYAVLGMFLEVISCMLITLPLVYPLVLSLGFDGIWLAVLITLNMELALITPPVGLNLFVISGLGKTPIGNVLRGVFPYFLILVGGLILVALVPALSTWLPNLLVSR